MSLPVDVFTQHLVESELISRAELRRFLTELSDQSQGDTFEQLAGALVQAQKLTAYQVETLYRGQGSDLILGNYVILDQLGAGGMGQVFRALHRRMERKVAVKVLPPGMMQERHGVERFHREVRAAARLAHPNIVTAHDADETRGIHYLVMEYVDGEDLATFVRNRGLLSVGMACSCVSQAARGLLYAHNQGIVHRDIKPSNLLIDPAGDVKVLDLGLARFRDEGTETLAEKSSPGPVMGTVDYMSPEQARNSLEVDQRSDVYSLGITLFYLLTGRPAYTGKTNLERLMAHRDAPIPSLSAAREDVPPELDAIFQTMVAKDPAQRFPSMREVIVALEPFLPLERETPLPPLMETVSEVRKLEAFLDRLERQRLDAGLTTGDEAFDRTADGLPSLAEMEADARQRTDVVPNGGILSVSQHRAKPEARWLIGLAATLLALAIGWYFFFRGNVPADGSGGPTAPEHNRAGFNSLGIPGGTVTP